MQPLRRSPRPQWNVRKTTGIGTEERYRAVEQFLTSHDIKVEKPLRPDRRMNRRG